MELGSVSAAQWLLAVLPIVVLVVLVVRGTFSTGVNGLLSAFSAILLGAVAFGAGPAVFGVAIGKGVWTGVWILYVIWTAMLVYQFASTAGLDRMGATLSSVLPRDVENVLLVAWVFPSFVQGVAGFGTPIAVAAPLLLSMGLTRVQAVALPLVGYHWAVTFGSMGSSFYMAALTAGLRPSGVAMFAQDASLVLGVNMLIAGALVALLHSGWQGLRDAWRMLLTVGAAMFVVLNLVVRLEPSIGSVSAGAAGLAAVGVLRLFTRTREPSPALARVGGGAADAAAPSSVGRAGEVEAPENDHEGGRFRAVIPLVPYVVLLTAVLAVFLPPASREFVKSNLLIGPSFPATQTSAGVTNASVDVYTPIALLGHPGTYILFAALVGLVIYRMAGAWPRGSFAPAMRQWSSKIRRSTLSVLALTTLATVMVDTGMVRTIAAGAAAVTGSLYPVIAPVVGALGSFTTGSTTTSNALFSALQHDVAQLIDVGGPELLAAQTAGGNVGNSMAPVVILIGATAISAEDVEGEIFRRVLWPCVLLLISVAALTQFLIWMR